MTADGKARARWFDRFFEPTTDFYELLNHQADKTLEGVEALAAWLLTDGHERCNRVKDLETEADGLKIDLERKLVESFVTPFDREDIFQLSTSLDEVINNSKAIVREMEAFEVPTDAPAIRLLSELLVDGTTCLRNSIRNLKGDLREAQVQALLARKAENRFVKAYRIAMQDLLQLDNFKTIMRFKEVYKQMIIGSERIDRVGELLLHIIVKLS